MTDLKLHKAKVNAVAWNDFIEKFIVRNLRHLPNVSVKSFRIFFRSMLNNQKLQILRTLGHCETITILSQTS